MKIKVDKAKFLEGLAAVRNVLVDACKNDRMHYIVDDGKVKVEDTAVFKSGMVKEVALGDECPECGGDVDIRCYGPEDEDEVYVCNRCGKQLPPEIFERKTYAVSADAVAEFAKKSLGCRYVQSCGEGNYRLGKLYGKHAYFCISPDAGHFNSHNENVILVVCDTSSVPKGWPNDTCKVVPLTELFYIKNGEIRVADIIDELKPKVSEPRFGKFKRVADRRDEWLQVLAHLLAKPYDPRDFRKNKKTLKMMLTSTAAARCFAKLYPGIKVTPKQFTRDMMAFCAYDRKSDVYDKREPVIATLLKAASDPKYTDAQRMAASKFAMDQLLKAKKMAEDNGGYLVNLPDVRFAVGADGRSEAISAVPEDSVYGRIAI